MVLVGVNVDHTQLVELAEEHFVNPETSWSDVTSSEVDGSISQYTGGIIEVLWGKSMGYSTGYFSDFGLFLKMAVTRKI